MRALLTTLFYFSRRRRHVAIWLAGMLAALIVIAAAVSPSSPLEKLNFLVFDSYQTLSPRAAAESAVLVVDIDDESIRQLGQWPWSRTMLARMIDRLTEQGAATIGLDMILSEPDRTSDAVRPLSGSNSVPSKLRVRSWSVKPKLVPSARAIRQHQASVVVPSSRWACRAGSKVFIGAVPEAGWR